MSSQPQWAPLDDEAADLLALVAVGPLAPPTADAEWDFYQRALTFAATADDGVVRPNTLRSLVRGHVAPQRIGAFTNRALAQGLIVATGDWETSNDTEGRNSGKPARVYRWIGGAS